MMTILFVCFIIRRFSTRDCLCVSVCLSPSLLSHTQDSCRLDSKHKLREVC